MEEIFTDPRDGETYKTVQIGNLIWFAENLRYQGVKRYFPNRDSDNVSKYGCLYTWQNAKKACPSDWRLPTKDDFEQLLIATGAGSDSSIIRASSWENGSDSSSFGALPAGSKGNFTELYYFSSSTSFWSATPRDSGDFVHCLLVCSIRAYVNHTYIDSAISVRFVKDIQNE